MVGSAAGRGSPRHVGVSPIMGEWQSCLLANWGGSQSAGASEDPVNCPHATQETMAKMYLATYMGVDHPPTPATALGSTRAVGRAKANSCSSCRAWDPQAVNGTTAGDARLGRCLYPWPANRGGDLMGTRPPRYCIHEDMGCIQ